jgi:hypothetical protein
VEAEPIPLPRPVSKDWNIEDNKWGAAGSQLGQGQQLRAYLAALKDMLTARNGEIQKRSHVDQWLTWALEHADRPDPLISA